MNLSIERFSEKRTLAAINHSISGENEKPSATILGKWGLL